MPATDSTIEILNISMDLPEPLSVWVQLVVFDARYPLVEGAAPPYRGLENIAPEGLHRFLNVKLRNVKLG